MPVLDEKSRRVRELEIRIQLEKQLALLKKYEEENKLEFFGIADKGIAERHKDCCKIGRGPNPKQAELLDAWKNPAKKVFTYTGANRIGKTTIATVIAESLMIGKWLWSKEPIQFSHKLPRKIRYVGQDWEKHIKTVVEPELKKWWPRNRKVETKKNNFGVDAFWVDVETGSSLEIMSNLQDAEQHEGWSGDVIIYDEPPRKEIRIANARGLIDRKGRELFSMTLLKEPWVNREVINARNEDGTPDMSVFNVHGDISVNIGFGIEQEGIDQFAKTLTSKEDRDARLKGIPSYMSGLIYPQFNRDKHLVPRFKVPTHWIVDISIDVHPREKQAVLFLATNERNERYGCEEIWEHGDGTQIADEIVRVIQRNAYRIGRVIIDPLSKGDENNKETVYEKVATVLARHDMTLGVATKDKTAGILEVKNHLLGPNNQPSIWFFDDLKRFAFEIEGYMWDKETQKPQDKDDHMMENLYRLLLLNTKYYDPEYAESKTQKKVRNAQTGY